MKWFRSGEVGFELTVQIDILRFGVCQWHFKGLVTGSASIETDSSTFVRDKASPVGGILARLFFEKLSRVKMTHPR